MGVFLDALRISLPFRVFMGINTGMSLNTDTLKITPEILSLIAELNEFKGRGRREDAIDLTENHIKQLHRDLLVHSTKDERHRGHYKTHPNSVSAFDTEGKEIGVVFETATPFDTPRLMTELVDWTRQTATRSRSTCNPLWKPDTLPSTAKAEGRGIATAKSPPRALLGHQSKGHFA